MIRQWASWLRGLWQQSSSAVPPSSPTRPPAGSNGQESDRVPPDHRRTWRKAAILLRPLVLTISAALAFAGLLRLHHARFENGLVRTFQRQQLEAVHGLAASVKEQVDRIHRDLESIANYPGVRRLNSGMAEILSSYQKTEGAALDGIRVENAQGRILWSSSHSPRARGAGGENRGSPESYVESPRNLQVRLPIESQGRRVGTLCAAVNVHRVSVACKSKADSTYKSLYWLLSDAGVVVDDDDTISVPRRVTGVLRDAGASKEKLRNVELLPYVVGQCVVAGQSGLAEVVRRDDGVDELIAFAPVRMEGRRFCLVVGSPRAEVSVPIASHERVTYALIGALALLYFATGYVAYRSEHAHAQLAEHRRLEAEQASKAKGDFLARMSHELRTPMNGVIAMTELALTTEDDAERQRYMRTVKDSADSLLTVIGDILDISKIEAGRMELDNVAFNLPECLLDTLESLSPLAEQKGLSLRWEVAPGTPSIVAGDPGRLRQILGNLVGNAIKFTSSGEVVVRVGRCAGPPGWVTLQFSVSDTGMGMSLADRQQVFVAYHRPARGNKYRKNSTGLGLAIAKQFVELMGGTIWVDSEPNKGSVFSFTARFALAPDEPKESETEPLPPLAGVRVLVVSAVPANRARIADLLKSWGAEAACAESSPAGLSVIKTAQEKGEPFRLVLYDDGGQPQDAPQFAQALAELEGGGKTTLVALYTGELRGDATKHPETGIDTYLGVPFSDSQLYNGLRMAMKQVTSKTYSLHGPANQSPEAPSLRILLVEDDPVNQQAASLLLSRWGHKVWPVASGEEAVSILSEREFDLVFMDLEMPGMDGIEATARIRQQDQAHGRRTTIVVMTAHALDGDSRRCMEAGMDGYISKPFRLEHLYNLIAKIAAGGEGRPLPPQEAVSRPAAPRDQSAWDLSRVRHLADGNEHAVGLIVKAFLEDLRKTLPAAQQAAVAGDCAALAKLAHRWKSALDLLGARRALAWTVRLEEACGTNEKEHLMECFNNLCTELDSLEKAMSLSVKENVQCKSC